VRCRRSAARACDRNNPAAHVRPQFDAVIELAEDIHGATMRKDFSRVPLHPEDARP